MADKIKMSDEELVNYVLAAHKRAKTFRDNFSEKIDKSIEQYNCIKPEEWKKKEKWQTKIFIPMQYKDVEVAASMLVKMLIAQKDFFETTGFDSEEEDLREGLTQLVVHLLQKGNFYNIAALALKEACMTSTCFLKTLDVSKSDEDFTLKFIPRTFHDILIDPSVTFYWVDSRFIIDEYERDIADVIGSDLYKYGKKSFEELKKMDGSKGSTSYSAASRRSLEGINESTNDETYSPVNLKEFHGKVKDPTTKEDTEMVLVVANDKYLIRKDEVEEERPYDVIRVNPIPKQFYGNGLCNNKHDLQDLMNGVVNLWMDSWKLTSMKMIAVEPNGNVKWETVKFEPAAIWEADPRSIKPIDFGLPVDGMAAMSTIDQIGQETSGITKISQGQNMPGSDETLGEVQIKLSRSDNRFLQIAKFIEAEFLGRFIKKTIDYTIKHCPQSYVDKVLGVRKVKRNIPILDPLRNIIGMDPKMVNVKRLDLDYIRKQKDLSLDFKPVGISRFANKAEEQQRYKELLQGVLGNEQMQMLFDVRKVAKKTMQATGFEDIEDLMRDTDEIEALMGKMGGGGNAPDFQPSQTENEIVTPEVFINGNK